MAKPREWWIEFDGEIDSKECIKRYVSTQPFKQIKTEEIVHVIEKSAYVDLKVMAEKVLAALKFCAADSDLVARDAIAQWEKFNEL